MGEEKGRSNNGEGRRKYEERGRGGRVGGKGEECKKSVGKKRRKRKRGMQETEKMDRKRVKK